MTELALATLCASNVWEIVKASPMPGIEIDVGHYVTTTCADAGCTQSPELVDLVLDILFVVVMENLNKWPADLRPWLAMHGWRPGYLEHEVEPVLTF